MNSSAKVPPQRFLVAGLIRSRVLVVETARHAPRQTDGRVLPFHYTVELPDTIDVGRWLAPGAQAEGQGTEYEVAALLQHARPTQPYVDVHTGGIRGGGMAALHHDPELGDSRVFLRAGQAAGSPWLLVSHRLGYV